MVNGALDVALSISSINIDSTGRDVVDLVDSFPRFSNSESGKSSSSTSESI
jgi:hypothetical protein